MKIRKYLYNWDNGTVDLYITVGMKISLLCEEIESEIIGSMTVLGKLEALKIEKPIEYAQMVFDGTMQKYCDIIDDVNRKSASILFGLYKVRFPDMSDAQINSLIREFQMYDN